MRDDTDREEPMADKKIGFGDKLNDAGSLDDAAFLRSIRWRSSAERTLVRPAQEGQTGDFCTALRSRASRVRRKRHVGKQPRQSLPLILQPLWSQHAFEGTDSRAALAGLLVDVNRRLDKSSREIDPQASEQVKSVLNEIPIETSPWTQIAWMIVLATAGPILDEAALMALWRGSLTELLSSTSRREGGESETEDDRRLLAEGELCWAAGLMFGEVKGAARLRQRGRSVLRKGVKELTDGDGTPHARTLHRLPLLLAVLTRSASVGKLYGENLFSGRSAERYEDLLTQAALISQIDGRLALSNGASFATGSLLRTASRLAGLPEKAPPARRLEALPDDAPSHRSKRKKTVRLPAVKGKRTRPPRSLPSTQSDWAELTCMRNNWSEGGDACVIAHHGVSPQLSVTAFERLLIDGNWSLAVEVDNVPLELTAGWSCVCWFSDEDADYVELQQDTDSGVTLLRQVLLSRTDHWLLLADNAAVIDSGVSRDTTIAMTSRLPLTDRVQTHEDRWTREVAFRCGKLQGRAVPLGLQQERSLSTDGSMTVSDSALILSQSGRGGALQMPLILEWSPSRQGADVQWRQLTVAEDGQRILPSVASGQRLRIGKHQWLFYRSHREGETGRTILGHHTPHETVVAEFTSAGEVEPIVLVE